MTTRTRFAPSPTGRLHAGNARTALFNYLFARANNGRLILRIDDSDEARSTTEFEEGILKDLKWLGIEWDEGEDVGGDFGPYRQSLRKELYAAKAEELLSAGAAYNCYCSIERLEELKKTQLRAKRAPRYDNLCRGLTDIPKNIEPVIRFKVPSGDVGFTDAVHGDMTFNADDIGDFIITSPTAGVSYNFATSVDDALMEITDVIRGDDHISNTPRQILLIRALGGRAPRYAHLPLVLGEDRSPLSKRGEANSIDALRRSCYLPEAILNAIANLGWAVGKYKTIGEMAEAFTLKGLSKSAGVFNLASLKDFNKRAIERASAKEIRELISPSFPDVDDARIEEVANIAKAGALSIGDIVEMLTPLLTPLTAPKETQRLKEAKDLIADSIETLNDIEVLDEANYKVIIDKLKAKGYKGKALFKPLRLALTGRDEGMELRAVLEILGKDEAIERLANTLKEL